MHAAGQGRHRTAPTTDCAPLSLQLPLQLLLLLLLLLLQRSLMRCLPRCKRLLLLRRRWAHGVQLGAVVAVAPQRTQNGPAAFFSPAA
jgi:hypothetical protein